MLKFTKLREGLYIFEDSCKIYVFTCGCEAILVDIGTGSVLEELAELGVDHVSNVLLTHHHRDSAQGATLAAEMGARVWVPHAEQDLFRSLDAHWQSRDLYNSYNNRQDRFSLLESLPVHTLKDNLSYSFGSHTFTVIPTPGHTPGSISLLTRLKGEMLAFTGDLIAAPGKLWSLAATQWSYNGAEGVAASIASLLELQDVKPDVLAPTHGEVMFSPAKAVTETVRNLWDLLQARGENLHLFNLRDTPYRALTPHFLWNRTSMAYSYVLLSASGKALLIDYGYDFMTGQAAGYDRAAKRPWLYTLPKLKRDFGVNQIDVVLPTHYHDDHVAGFNGLREVEGTEVWAATTMADILEAPSHYNLACLWYDAIPVDRKVPLEQPLTWEEYTLTLYAQPGHTRYAVAVSLEVDGKRVLAIGDQYAGGKNANWNYVYNNVFHPEDYRASAALYKKLNPELIVSGHWQPYWVAPGYINTLEVRGKKLAELHRALLPDDFYESTGPDFLAHLEPYQNVVKPCSTFTITATVYNPFAEAVEAELSLVLPKGFQSKVLVQALEVPALATASCTFQIMTSSYLKRRARVGLDLRLAGKPYGQVAEALVSTTEEVA